MLDLLIVGTGPAGVSAALTARARGLSFLWFGSRFRSSGLAAGGSVTRSKRQSVS